jgi:hypothetical protein
MDAGKHDNGRAANDRPNDIRRLGTAKIRVASPDRLPDTGRRHFYKTDIGKTFGAQQRLAD